MLTYNQEQPQLRLSSPPQLRLSSPPFLPQPLLLCVPSVEQTRPANAAAALVAALGSKSAESLATLNSSTPGPRDPRAAKPIPCLVGGLYGGLGDREGVGMCCYVLFTHPRVCLVPDTTTAGVSAAASTGGLIACPKCGTTKAGKLTCCVRGGSWFKKCGNPGDPKFEHTWAEGTESCKSKLLY